MEPNQGSKIADFSVDNQNGYINTGIGIIKGGQHQVDQGFVVCVYGPLANVKVEVQFVKGGVDGVCLFLNGAQKTSITFFCLSNTNTHKLLKKIIIIIIFTEKCSEM